MKRKAGNAYPASPTATVLRTGFTAAVWRFEARRSNTRRGLATMAQTLTSKDDGAPALSALGCRLFPANTTSVPAFSQAAVIFREPGIVSKAAEISCKGRNRPSLCASAIGKMALVYLRELGPGKAQGHFSAGPPR